MKSIAIAFVIALLVSCKAESEECTDCATDNILQEFENQESTAISDSTTTDSMNAHLTSDPKQLLVQLQNRKIEFDFYASFTEPFWTIYLIGEQILFNQADSDPAIYPLDGVFDSTQIEQKLSFTDANSLRKLLIIKDGGSDGMSELKYPYSVVMDGNFHGGGDVDYVHE